MQLYIQEHSLGLLVNEPMCVPCCQRISQKPEPPPKKKIKNQNKINTQTQFSRETHNLTSYKFIYTPQVYLAVAVPAAFLFFKLSTLLNNPSAFFQSTSSNSFFPAKITSLSTSSGKPRGPGSFTFIAETLY